MEPRAAAAAMTIPQPIFRAVDLTMPPTKHPTQEREVGQRIANQRWLSTRYLEARLTLFDDGQHVAGIYRHTCGRRYFLYDSPFWRLDFVLHFHRFDYDDALAGFDGGIFRDQQAHHAAGHESQDSPGSLFVSGSLLARA